MKINTIKNASRNITFSVFKKIYISMMSFFMRTIMIYLLGIEYAGLNGVFTSLLNVLNLAELGVGTAIVYNMYKPIAEDDQKKICELLQLYKVCYRGVGIAILFLGLLCLPFLDNWITGEIPENLNIYVLFLMHLLTTVCSYCFFSYKSSIFNAHQRTDVESKVNIVVNTIRFVVQVIILFGTRNYYAYLFIDLVTTLSKNTIVAVIAKKMYPHYEAQGRLAHEERKNVYKNVRDIFISKIGGVVVNSVDTLVISAVLGITVLGIYQNYYFIVSTISGVVVLLYRSCIAGLGNRIALNKTESVYVIFENMSFWIVWVCSFCCSAFLCLMQPFVQGWVGKEMLLDYKMVILFCGFFYVFQLMGLCGAFEDAAGIWKYDRLRPLLEAAVNFSLNLIMVQFIGLYGILLSTIISMICFSLPWLLRNLFENMFQRSMKDYLLKMLKWSLAAILFNVTMSILGISNPSATLFHSIVRTLIYMLFSVIIFWILYHKNEPYQWAKSVVLSIRK